MEIFENAIQTIKLYRKSIGLSDILDIILITFICYRLLVWLRSTNSIRVLKGVFLLIVFVWISSILKLNVVNYVLGKAMELGLLAIIIVFQPELRRFLERVGSGKLKNLFKNQESDRNMEYVIGQVVLLCSNLSREKIGALIVFERDMLLTEWLKTGTFIDAETGESLLHNIFYPKAPLHDGAVIVRDGRILGAGCMLPLSGNVNLSRALGMRHRAGIGISEQTDAVAVIVSEENGAVSVAVGGMLKRHLTPETLEKLLRNELLPIKEESEKSKRVMKIFKVKNDEKTKD